MFNLKTDFFYLSIKKLDFQKANLLKDDDLVGEQSTAGSSAAAANRVLDAAERTGSTG